MTYDPDARYREREAEQAARKDKRWDELVGSARMVLSITGIALTVLAVFTIGFAMLGKHYPFWMALGMLAVAAATVAAVAVEWWLIDGYMEDDYADLFEFWGYTGLVALLYFAIAGLSLWGVLGAWTYGP